MTRLWRITILLVGVLGLAALLALAFLDTPGPAPLRDDYLRAANALAVPARHVTDVVSAVNFDYRAFDTLGEEFILFVSVMGALVLLREGTPKPDRSVLSDALTPGRALAPSAAMRAWIWIMIAPKVLFGLYIVTHGAISPGGGFQGGVILATAPLIVYLAEDFRVFRKIVPFHAVEAAEAGGAATFVVIGCLGLLLGSGFLANVVPLGRTGQITAGGMVPLISLATGLEVAAGFVLLLYAFLQEVLTPQGGEP